LYCHLKITTWAAEYALLRCHIAAAPTPDMKWNNLQGEQIHQPINHWHHHPCSGLTVVMPSS